MKGSSESEDGLAVAWVESPLQLLCVIEAQHAGLLGPATRVVPRSGLPALRLTRAEMTRLDLPPGLDLAEPAARMPKPGRTWVFGDAFSGRVQLSLLTSPPRRVVLVDDGLATIRLLELLVARRPLLRARAEPGLARRVLGAAAGLRLRGGRLTVFTALPVPDALAEAVRERGAELVRHDFGWLRSQPGDVPPDERTVVLGTSLVRNGLIHRDAYVKWLAAIDEPVAYYPHRREDPRDLERVRGIAGVTVYETGVPAEMTLRGLRPGQRVLSLPSTAVTSLRILLRARGVSIETVEVPDDWWTASAGPSLRSHLQLFAHERVAP
ncbi:hypothetical protein Aph01nite_63120 [Acrocarpospora phusangensis]|uniref:Uncharacterized protein n=1 Tax=Acrocarpospora phusangensis TaxID=1070424 RepID=A0A919QKT5_9ACTN|nr:hypothetical protein [Acrocarpospora phusangensis]GIH28002.1 hypothetical protein Aph01nite_63120 [Acrocarpospora phusangensis]